MGAPPHPLESAEKLEFVSGVWQTNLPSPARSRLRPQGGRAKFFYPRCLLWGGGSLTLEPPPLLSQAGNRRNICLESGGSVNSKLVLGTQTHKLLWL